MAFSDARKEAPVRLLDPVPLEGKRQGGVADRSTWWANSPGVLTGPLRRDTIGRQRHGLRVEKVFASLAAGITCPARGRGFFKVNSECNLCQTRGYVLSAKYNNRR